MALEDLTGPDKFIDALVNTNPPPADPLDEGNFHLSGIKNVLVNSFPGVASAVNASGEQIERAALSDPATKATLGDSVSFANVTLPDAGSALAVGPGGATDYLSGVSRSSVRTSYSPTGTPIYAELAIGASNWPVARWLYTGVAEFVAFLSSAGKLYFTKGPITGVAADETNAPFAIENGFASVIGISRTNTGLRDRAGTWDMGKAPGIARGAVVTNPSSGVTQSFPFPIANPRIALEVVGDGTTLMMTRMYGVTNDGFSVNVVSWNGTAWNPIVATVHWIACDESLAAS